MEQNRCPITFDHVLPRALPIATARQGNQRIPSRYWPILRAAIRWTPSAAGKFRRERRIERTAIDAGLATGDNLG